MTDIYELIKKAKADKQERGGAPSYVVLSELQSIVLEELRKELNSLYSQGKIRVGETLNSKYVDTTE